MVTRYVPDEGKLLDDAPLVLRPKKEPIDAYEDMLRSLNSLCGEYLRLAALKSQATDRISLHQKCAEKEQKMADGWTQIIEAIKTDITTFAERIAATDAKKTETKIPGKIFA